MRFFDFFNNIKIFGILIDELIFSILNFVGVFLPIIILVAYVTLLERKVMGSMQKRRGPNVTGFFGILQPIADGLKLLIKEPVFPYQSNKILFILSPFLTFTISISSWAVIPFSSDRILGNFEYDLLYIFALSSLGVYGIVISGWSSNSKYAFLGALRSTAQMISYEISFCLSILPVVVISGSLNLIYIVECQKYIPFYFTLFPSAFCFFISILAETNRSPFDLPEAEGELVAGYNVEYSGMYFALFYLAEYLNIILMSTLFVILFMGGWYFLGVASPLIFAIKIYLIIYIIIWVRATFPRYRFDQLMKLGWKVLLPFTLCLYIYICGLLLFIFQFLSFFL